MANDERMTKPQTRSLRGGPRSRYSDFGFLSSFVIRISSFSVLQTMPVAAIKLVFEGHTEEGVFTFLSTSAFLSAAGELGNFFRFGDQVFALFGQLRRPLGRQRPVEIFLALNPRLQADGSGIQGRFGPN